MLEPGSIIGIVSGSIGVVVALVKLVKRSADAPRSRLSDVQGLERSLLRKLRKAEDEVSFLDEARVPETYDLRNVTQNLINHSYLQIEKFEKFSNKFEASPAVRGWHYIAISAGKDDIQKYDKRFAMYWDWIVIAQLCISLTRIMAEQKLKGEADVPASYRSDVKWLRDKLASVRRDKEEQSERLRKLRVNKGVHLEQLEDYAKELLSLLGFDDSDADTWERDRGYGKATKADPPIGRSSRTPSMRHDHVHNKLRKTPSSHTPSARYRRDAERGQDDRRSNYSRSQSRTEKIYSSSSGSRRSSTPTPDSRYDSDRARGGRRPRERHRYSTSSDRADTMTSGFGLSESVESRQHSRRRRISRSPSNETHARSRSRQSYQSRHDSGKESWGRDTRRGNFQDTPQNLSSPLRYRSQSRPSHFSRHTDERQEQQRRGDGANMETRPSARRHRSRSSNTNVSLVPSHDSGYGSLDPEIYSRGASNTSTDARSRSRPRLRRRSRFDRGDRSRPPIALDRRERGIRKAEEGTRRKGRGAE